MKKETHPNWPRPPKTAEERLNHTLDIFEDYPDDMKVLTATENIYGAHGTPDYRTGITLGDLREFARVMSATRLETVQGTPEELAIELMTSQKSLTHGKVDAHRLLSDLRQNWGHEIATVQRTAHDTTRPYFHQGQPCKPEFDCHVSKIIDLADNGDGA